MTMTQSKPKIGSIWSVPALGKHARCLILAGPNEVYRGQAEYRVMPLAQRSRHSVTEGEIAIPASETAHRIPYIGFLYNICSIPAAALAHGDCVDLILAADAFVGRTRDAYREFLRADSQVGWLEGISRKRAVARWQSLSGQISEQAEAEVGEAELYELLDAWGELADADWMDAVINGQEAEDPLPVPTMLMYGPNGAQLLFHDNIYIVDERVWTNLRTRAPDAMTIGNMRTARGREWQLFGADAFCGPLERFAATV